MASISEAKHHFQPQPSTSHDCPNAVAGQLSQKKRTRRKPRHRDRKKLVSEVEEVETSYDFAITTAKNVSGRFYNKRHQTFAPINAAYLKRSHRFKTKCETNLNMINIESKFNNLTMNESSSTPKQKKEGRMKRETKKFEPYWSEKKVLAGLDDGTLFKGFIRINPNNPNDAYVGHEDSSKYDYQIGSLVDRNRALDGDHVVLRERSDNTDKRKLMEVVHLLERIHPRTTVGTLEAWDKNKNFGRFLPRDKRVPIMKIPGINLPSGFQSNPDLYKDILFVAKIVNWKEVRFADGLLTENLGLKGDLKVESLAILREFCLDPTPYREDIKKFLPSTTDLPEKELSYREDLRKQCVFTIDPATARDLDDAVSCKALDNGNFEVGVHISDVSFYLEENTKLDNLVRKKATTVYMIDSVYHMLPLELCLQCSLLPGEDKLTFSVFWEMTNKGEVISHRISRTVINSCAQLSYEHAQKMIDESDKIWSADELPAIHNDFTPKHLSEVVNNLQGIAVCLREKRKQAGALKIDQIKLSFRLDPLSGEPQEFYVYENKPSHRLIEEFMLLANMTVAQTIFEAFPDLAFLRLHDPPKPTMMIELQRNLETVGMHIDIASSGGIQSSLKKYESEDFLGQTRMLVLNHLFAKPMTRARYFCAGALENDRDISHFALSMPIYTHFTSPIRRYADIMVHRLLVATFKKRLNRIRQIPKRPKWMVETVASIATNCNLQKYHAKKAGDASCDLYLAHYIEQHQPCIEEAVVVDTKERTFDVIVIKTGSVVRIFTNNFDENVTWKSEEIKIQPESYAAEQSQMKPLWRIYVEFPKTEAEPSIVTVLEMFTLVRVQLSRKPKTNKLEATLLRPKQLI